VLKGKIWSLIDHTGEKSVRYPRGDPMRPSPWAGRLPGLCIVDTLLMGELSVRSWQHKVIENTYKELISTLSDNRKLPMKDSIIARFPQQMVASRDPLLSSTSLTFDALPPSLHVLLEPERAVGRRVEARRVEVEHAEVAVAHVEVDNSEHRSLFVLTNIVWYARFSSSVGVFD